LWLKAQLLTMLLVGTVTGIGLWLIGVPSWFALALLAALLEFVPYVGPIAAAVPAILLAATVDPQTALLTIGLYALVQQLEGYVFSPAHAAMGGRPARCATAAAFSLAGAAARCSASAIGHHLRRAADGGVSS
jgi:hypothetical protein